MKRLITNYTFNKAAKTITFNDYTSINLEQILLITNTTSNKIIYNFANLGGSVSENVLTLAYNTSSMNNTDKLQIFYDDAVYDSHDANGNLLIKDNAHFENPFGTAEGQLVVSSSENFWARLSRIGRPRSKTASAVAVSATAGVLVSTGGITASIGCALYPTVCSVSCTVDAVLVIQAPNAGLQDGEIMYAAFAYAKAGTPLVVRFDGEGYCKENVGISIGAIPLTANSGGLIYGSCSGIEVEVNY